MPATPPWTGEEELDEEAARARIAARFPEFALSRVKRLGSGWDNTAFLVDDAWVFRFPRRAVAVPLIETEMAVLPGVAPRLPLPITAPERAAPARAHGANACTFPRSIARASG